MNACDLASRKARRTGMTYYVYQDKNYEWRTTMHEPPNWKMKYFPGGRSEARDK
jgi:hypothetical protein